MRISDIPQIIQLTIPEKILLVEDIWDSIASDEFSIPIPHSHTVELDRRNKHYKSDPDNLLSLEELKAKIEKRK